MILKIQLSNFYSINQEVTIDFTAEGRKKNLYSANLINFNGDKFVNVIGLFGSNAAGKSNLIKAVDFSRNLVLNSTNNNEGVLTGYEPFKFDPDKTSTFRINFEWEDIEYEYSFELLKNRIISESLFYYPQKRKAKIFLRENTHGYSYGKGLIQRPTEIETSTGSQTLFLSRGNSMNRPILQKVYKFFKDGLWIEKNNYNLDDKSRKIIENNKTTLLKALEISDSDIIDFRLSELSPGTPILHTFHRENPIIPFDFIREESEGTRRLFHILLMIIDKAQSNVTIFFDEFDLKLHLKLSEFILDIIASFGKAQLVFTSHNPSLLNREKLRDEQIIFVTKLNDGSSEFVPLCDYENTDKIKDLPKAYLQGRFDGIPYIGTVKSISQIL